MRTKTLLIAAVALAAGILTSSAQTYSQNIVGYVNVTLPMGFSVVSIPLNSGAATGNALTNTIANTGQLDGAYLYQWNGSGYAVDTFDSGMPTGFGDAADLVSVPTPVINPGVAFFINNNTGVILTNTFVGSVAINSLPGTTTNNLPAGFTFVSSVLPVGGGLTSVLQLTNNAGALDGTYIYMPNIVSGTVHGYNIITIDSGMPSGYANAADLASVPEPQFPISGGFLYNNNVGGGTIQWVQILNP
ncbi:MAG TPA: hypothetical protein VIK28_01890 [Sedimentisphaerales bacterium]